MEMKINHGIGLKLEYGQLTSAYVLDYRMSIDEAMINCVFFCKHMSKKVIKTGFLKSGCAVL